MADKDRGYRDANHLGSRSPGSQEAQQQNAAGQRGGPGGEGQRAESDQQVPQTSGRRGAQHQEGPEERKHFEGGKAPSGQGEKEHPSPHVIAQNQQGIGGQSPSHGAHRETSEGEAQSGEPGGTHTRHAQHGRQQMPGDR
jgi:hypothetical protein